MQFTGRTAYLVQGSRELLLFLSAQRAAHADGRLCCACGNRTERRLLARFSADGGASWGEPLILRDDFHSANGWPDLGYPRLYQRRDGRLVVVYFWCTRDRPETHIEATIFSAT